jgi:uncharacterized protein
MSEMLLYPAVAPWTASELVDFFTCAHRGTLERAARAGRRERPAPSGEAAVVARRGLAHEAAYLAQLRAAGVAPTEIVRPLASADYDVAAAATTAAFARGDAAVVNATFAGDGFRGVADLALRVAGASVFGAWSYEIVDIRLAARSEPAALVQVCAYTDALAALLDVPFDEMRMHVVVADGRRETFAAASVGAFYRALRARMLAQRDAGRPTSPEKIDACARCRWNAVCAADRAAADDLSLVATIRRAQVRALREAGIATLGALAAAAPERRPPALAPATWEKLHEQAALQAAAARTGVHTYRLLPPDPCGGFALLPPASPGDVYFDMEGDPFVPGGLEYLFGLTYADDAGELRFRPVWAHEPERQLAAAATVLRFIGERRAADPSMHVFHYAPYERTALTRLTAGTPYEADLDALFRAEVFVDLYAVVRGALRVSTPSYSIKSLELFYRGHKRTSDVADAMGSVVAYEEYLQSHDPAILERIREYNQDDCDSTRELHHWLLERKAEAYARFGPPQRAATDEPREAVEDAELETMRATLAARASHDVLLGDLLEYHRRELRPQWREYFERLRSDLDALAEDPKCLAGLVPVAGIAPEVVKQSLAHVLDFPPQTHGFRAGDRPVDPATGKGAGEIASVTNAPDGSGRIVLKRGPKLATTALPRALVPKDIVPLDEVQKSLRRIGRAVAAGERAGLAGALLERALPRRRSGVPVASGASSPAELATLIDDLADASVLVVQGPPGTGKTWTAARAIVDLLRRGRRVGVASGTHKAINNLLSEIERVAAECGYALRGVKKSDGERPETLVDSPSGAIADVTDAKAFPPAPVVRLIAGTPALFAREAMAGSVDVLVIDEAGQLALADAVAVSPAARTLVLAGDPRQLPHVTVGLHPAGAGASVLEHLLDGHATVPAERGVFLPRSYRMHPAIAAFVSELMYDGRLAGAPACARQRVVAPGSCLDGAGLSAIAVAHAGRSNAAPEEADAIVAAVRTLAASRFVGVDGAERPFDPRRDAIVVAPYNAQVAVLRERLDAAGFPAVRAGTVDKFQGQEASVVLYSMTTSSGDDVPHDVAFLFDRNRLNVAISRARALAVVVYAPSLLELRPRSIAELELLNALARFVECAAPANAGSLA